MAPNIKIDTSLSILMTADENQAKHWIPIIAFKNDFSVKLVF